MSQAKKNPDPPIDIPELCGIARERHLINNQIKALEKERKELDLFIETVMASYQTKSVNADGFRIRKADGHKETISKTKLVEKGIPLATIQECTKKTDYWYITITGPKETEERETELGETE